MGASRAEDILPGLALDLHLSRKIRCIRSGRVLVARTNIVLDDELIKRAMQVSGAKTKREAVDRALRELVARARCIELSESSRARCPGTVTSTPGDASAGRTWDWSRWSSPKCCRDSVPITTFRGHETCCCPGSRSSRWTSTGTVAAARLYRRLRSRGVTVRGTIDCVIAQTCMAAGVELLTTDQDFAAIARHAPLRLCPV